MEFLVCRCRERATLAKIEQTVKLWFAMLVIVLAVSFGGRLQHLKNSTMEC